ncbi:MAG: adenylyl-sulfate kinase [Nitrospirae bacterium]|nr:adenylyl-sulfate kinase [Nitrospirota bacterium]
MFPSHNKILMTVSLLFVSILISGSALADYKIILKNGREFVVDDYKELNGKIKFYREGGEIELDKDIIKDIKKTKALRPVEERYAPETTNDTPEKPPAEKSTQPQEQEIDSKLKEIARKKAQLRTEGEKLIADKKKLEEDIKKKGRVLAIREKRELEKKAAEIEEKINKVNEDKKWIRGIKEGIKVEDSLSGLIAIVSIKTPNAAYSSQTKNKLINSEIKGFTGIDDPYEIPERAEITLDTVNNQPLENARIIVGYLKGKGFLK